jgi:transcriptional regulator with XRE-family HTH domain
VQNEATIHPIRRERLRRGWSLVKLCAVTGIAPSNLSLVERGLQPAYPGWQRRIADAYGLAVEDLFPPTPKAPPAA